MTLEKGRACYHLGSYCLIQMKEKYRYCIALLGAAQGLDVIWVHCAHSCSVSLSVWPWEGHWHEVFGFGWKTNNGISAQLKSGSAAAWKCLSLFWRTALLSSVLLSTFCYVPHLLQSTFPWPAGPCGLPPAASILRFMTRKKGTSFTAIRVLISMCMLLFVRSLMPPNSKRRALWWHDWHGLGRRSLPTDGLNISWAQLSPRTLLIK